VTRALAAALLASFAAWAFAVAPEARAEGPVPGTYALPPLGAAADGAVLDAQGVERRLHERFGDRIVLLSFVYASCLDPTGCPLAMAVMHQLQSRFKRDPELAARVTLISLSFDPERDTPEIMALYGQHGLPGHGDHGGHAMQMQQGATWHFLTTRSRRELEPILQGYGQPVQDEVDADGQRTGQISHLLRVFLIDRDRRIRNIYSSAFLEADVLESDIRTLALEATPATEAAPVERARARPAGIPLGLPPLPPEAAEVSELRVALGRKLFFDRRLSHNGTLSCGMCHIPEQGFTSHELATAVGIEGRSVRRNSPSLYNVAYARTLFHDGRERTLEGQVWGPLLARNEMGNPSVGRVLDRIAALPDYAGRFEAAFAGRAVGMETLGQALADYQRTLLLADSPFDRWRYGGVESSLDASARRGAALFEGRAGCVVCHPSGAQEGGQAALFTDHGFHNTGIGYRASMGVTGPTRVELIPGMIVELDAQALAAISEPPQPDLGLYEITEDPADRWRYRTPTLRNVALTAPYMHDGSLATLEDVVRFYNEGGIPNEALDPAIRPLALSPDEIRDLVAFLESLTGRGAEELAADARAEPIGDPR
jgi:cytochrome c peroxidase